MEFRSSRLWFKSHFYHILALWSWDMTKLLWASVSLCMKLVKQENSKQGEKHYHLHFWRPHKFLERARLDRRACLGSQLSIMPGKAQRYSRTSCPVGQGLCRWHSAIEIAWWKNAEVAAKHIVKILPLPCTKMKSNISSTQWQHNEFCS